jgi:hypothetical protein
MTTQESSNTNAGIAEKIANVASTEAPARKGGRQKKAAAKDQKRTSGSRTKGNAPMKKATSRKAPKPANSKRVPQSKGQGKGATIVALIERVKGASLQELIQATGWQAHSLRGFLSTVSKKKKLKLASAKNEAGERVYTATK